MKTLKNVYVTYARPAQPRLLILAMFAASGLIVCMQTTQAQSLAALYESARTFDASYQSAKLQYDATAAKADQAIAGILPTAGVSASVSHTSYQNTTPRVDRTFNTRVDTFTASQPLYRPANWASYEQGAKQVALAKALLDAAEQDLIVRTSQAYFDVLLAQDTLVFVRAQKAAVAEQLASAKRSFTVGTTTITDVREAQARYDLGVAQEIAAENDLLVKKLTLDTLVGRSEVRPTGLLAVVSLPPLEPPDVNAWVQHSEQVHPGIRQAENALAIAEQEVQKAEAGHKPTLDATFSYSVNRNPAGTASTIPPFAFNTTTANLGLSLNIPLFAGFATQNRVRETLALKDKAQSDLDGTRRTVALGTRTAYFGVLSGQGQVKALEAAELSSQSALDANKTGYRVGVRINVDVLNSQSQLFQTKRDLAQARYNVLLGSLRLRQANGSLSPDDLLQVNALLSK